MPRESTELPRRYAALALAFAIAACQENPERVPSDHGPTVGEEVYHVLCMRVAAATHPDDATGSRFVGPCDGEGTLEGANAKLAGMLEMRPQLVDALNVTLGDIGMTDPTQVVPGSFGEGELEQLLLDMLPLYEPPLEIVPEATRAAARAIREWLDTESPSSKAAIAALSALSGRHGYRPIERGLGPIRTFLAYPRLDDLTLSVLEPLQEGGEAHEPFVRALTALGLQLANWDEDEAQTGPNGPEPAPSEGDAGAIELALDLLMASDDALASGEEPIWVLKRDARGLPVPNAPGGDMPAPFVDQDGEPGPDVDARGQLLSADGAELPAPYKLSDAPQFPKAARDGLGRALNVWLDPQDPDPPLLHAYWDADRSVLAALLRDAGTLVERPEDGSRSAVENLTRGLRLLMGPEVDREETLGQRTVAFRGPNPDESPLLDLTHAVGTLLAYPEVRDFIEVARQLMESHEDVLARLAHVGLRIDAISDEPQYDGAQLVGEGGPGTPHDFWDDLLAVGMKVVRDRPGMLEPVIRSFADPRSLANTKLIAKWMRYDNVVVYEDASADDDRLASPDLDINGAATILADDQIAGSGNMVVAAYDRSIDPALPNTGWNRSVFQRVLSLVHNLDGQPVCNKDGAYLKSQKLIDLGLSPPAGEGPFEECGFVDIEDAVQIYNRSVLGTAEIVLKDSPSVQWTQTWSELGSLFGISGDIGQEQEVESKIDGFDLTPTPESLARFIFAPRNDFLVSLFDPLLTIDGVPIAEREPYALFPMEVVDPTLNPADMPDGPGTSFIEASVPLLEAFENHEARNDDGTLVDGYMFSHVLSALHMHWGLRSGAACSGPPEELGCTQSLDPTAPLFAYQTGVASYEPLIARALLDEGLADALYADLKALEQVSVDGKDGITVFSDLVRRLLTPDPDLQDRFGQPAVAQTNTGKPIGRLPMEKVRALRDPEIDPNAPVVEGVPPIYPLLDGFKRIDEVLDHPDHAERKQAWLSARSELVDLIMQASVQGTTPDAEYRLANRKIPPVGLVLLDWLGARIDAHREAGDLAEWGPGLAEDLEDILAHPASAAGLDILDIYWTNEAASREVADLLAYMLADPDPTTFASMVETVVHALQFFRDEERAEDLAKGLATVLDPDANDPAAASAGAESATMKGATAIIELAKLDEDRPTTFNKILRNTVEPLDGDGRSPLEIYIDAVFRVHREDSNEGAYGYFSEGDVRSILSEAADFLDNEDHGLERLIQVIQCRERGAGCGQGPPETVPEAGAADTPSEMAQAGTAQ